jgi:hypothetical protein
LPRVKKTISKEKPSAKCKSKKPRKNSKIILFYFLEASTSHHPRPRNFFLAFYIVFFTLFVKSWSVGFELVTYL